MSAVARRAWTALRIRSDLFTPGDCARRAISPEFSPCPIGLPLSLIHHQQRPDHASACPIRDTNIYFRLNDLDMGTVLANRSPIPCRNSALIQFRSGPVEIAGVRATWNRFRMESVRRRDASRDDPRVRTHRTQNRAHQIFSVGANPGALRALVACSKAYATRSKTGSLQARPKKLIPTGSP